MTNLKPPYPKKETQGRWFRLWRRANKNRRDKRSDIDRFFDFYWGGPERRITGLTLRIIAVNAIALLILVLGILYLGQYQNSLIEARLETFQTEVELVSAAISEGAIERFPDPAYFIGPPRRGIRPLRPDIIRRLSYEQGRKMVRRLSKTMGRRIKLFNEDGELIADSHMLGGAHGGIGGEVQMIELDEPRQGLRSIEILKDMTGFVMDLLPDRQILPLYPAILNPKDATNYPDAAHAIEGKTHISAWTNEDGRIFISGAAPISSLKRVKGAVLLTRDGRDIENDIEGVWIDVLRIFGGTLIITILLSIYLSGVIARPLRKLAKAAEAVRTGKATAADIPDMRTRHDEIGDLSVVLRDMTSALWERMDAMERFAADVSHELKNPLTSLRSAVETAARITDEKDREKLMNIIHHDVARLDRLITDISNASRLDTELSREAFEPINVKDILHQLLNIYRDPLERGERPKNHEDNVTTERDIQIRLNILSHQSMTVMGSEGRLIQLFQNLLSNALSFSPDNSIINISALSDGDQIHIIFEDQGPGIPEAKLETIFERFYSERPAHEDYGHHSGLGLSICKQIIDAHRGRIFAENIIGDAGSESGNIKGASFHVILRQI